MEIGFTSLVTIAKTNSILLHKEFNVAYASSKFAKIVARKNLE